MNRGTNPRKNYWLFPLYISFFFHALIAYSLYKLPAPLPKVEDFTAVELITLPPDPPLEPAQEPPHETLQKPPQIVEQTKPQKSIANPVTSPENITLPTEKPKPVDLINDLKEQSNTLAMRMEAVNAANKSKASTVEGEEDQKKSFSNAEKNSKRLEESVKIPKAAPLESQTKPNAATPQVVKEPTKNERKEDPNLAKPTQQSPTPILTETGHETVPEHKDTKETPKFSMTDLLLPNRLNNNDKLPPTRPSQSLNLRRPSEQEKAREIFIPDAPSAVRGHRSKTKGVGFVLNDYDWPYDSYMRVWGQTLSYYWNSNLPIDYVSGQVPQGGDVYVKVVLSRQGKLMSLEIMNLGENSRYMEESVTNALSAVMNLPPMPQSFESNYLEVVWHFKYLSYAQLFSR